MKKETYLLLFSFFRSLFASPSGDAAVISAIGKSLVGVPSDWNYESDPCNWYGIKCTAGRITSIDLKSKGISGTIPDSLAQLSSLENLDVGKNQISGRIPSLVGLSALQTLDIQHNSFTSVPDDLFSGLSSLQSVIMDNNPLAPWSIPLDLAQCANLQSFSAANTSITGGIPDIFDQLPALIDLRLSYNNLTGGLPSSFAGSNIKTLYLNDQREPGLSGPIAVVRAMPQLQLISLQSNNFTGPIPDLSNLTSLTSLDVRNNQLTGPVPLSLTSNLNLLSALLSNNMLQGPLPSFSGSVIVDVSQEQFCKRDPGPCDPRVTALLSVAEGFGYPFELANLWEGNDPCDQQWAGAGGVTCDVLEKDIVGLNFAGRQYVGTISPNIADLISLKEIILSGNNLTGPIPGSLTKLPQLRFLDLSNNNLTGNVPDFPPSVSLKSSGNPLLGGNSSTRDFGPSSDRTWSSSSAGNLFERPESSHGALVWGIIASLIVFICCTSCLIYYRSHKNCVGQVQTRSPQDKQNKYRISMKIDVHDGAIRDNYNHSNTNNNGRVRILEAQRMFIPFEVLHKATNDFNDGNILGRGEFCVVYKGELNGTLIAVKRNVSDIMDTKRMEQFRAEIDLLKKVRHRYLVALLGYCINDNETLLAYEYMSNGTLEQHLFRPNENGYSALSWNQRLTIAVDVARGIEYLHDLAQECFVHRDLNPSNILLDKDMRAKVSNFGLVKLVGSEKSITTRLAGSSGYLAPEYATIGKISTKIDVYAFGVILMELITGRRAIDKSLVDERCHLLKIFRRSIVNKEKLMNHVDSTLDLDEEAQSSLSDVADLAFNCTALEPNQRPDMGHVVNTLVPFVEKWNPIPCKNEVIYNEDSGTNLSQKLRKWQLDDGTSTWQFGDDTLMMGSFNSYK